MPAPVTISPDEPTNKGLDYAYLKAEGTTLVQQLAGKIWTDYNEHDPGVTTLEQLCYALTELSYRAEFPLADLLIDRPGGKINPRRQALFIPRRILPCNPLTADDYRKLLVDRVPQVANAWLTPYRSPAPGRAVNGLYKIALYVPDADPCVCDGDGYRPDEIRRRARRVYSRHRNLCEDVHAVFILRPVRTVVNALVTIGETLTPEAILAGIFFNLGNFLAPELRRQSLKSLLDGGHTPDEIFTGPLLRNGFISADQLQPKATEINAQEIIWVIGRSKGVTGVSGVSVHVGDPATVYGGDKPIPVKGSEILQLFTQAEAKLGGFSVKLFKDGIEYQPNPARVRRELDKLWAEARRTYKLLPQYDEFLSLPEGRYRDVEKYYSIQNQYPNVYGISAFGLPPEAGAVRRAQAKQLKGYLLVFEQLLADYLAQLAHVRDLYSVEYRLRETYFCQYLNDAVPDVAPLLKENYQPGLSSIIRSQDQFLARRNRFLDFLLALYAETLDASSVSNVTVGAGRDEDPGERLLRAKLALLHHLVESAHNRGRGFDYLAPPGAHNLAGMEIKSRIQLGLNAFDHRPLTDLLDEYAVEIVAAEADASVGRTLDRHADYIEEQFAPVPPPPREGERPGESDKQPAPPAALPRGQTVTEAFLDAAGGIENFRVGSLPGDDAVTVVCKSPTGDAWHRVGKYADTESAAASARALADLAQTLNRHSSQLYIVEHTLLRFGRSRPAAGALAREGDATPAEHSHREQRVDEHDQREFVYSFTITAVISTPARRRGGDGYQTLVREVIRQNTPSHIVAEYCFLNPGQLRRFESLYWAWRRALRRRAPREIIFTSTRLRNFLRRCQRRDARPTNQAEAGLD